MSSSRAHSGTNHSPYPTYITQTPRKSHFSDHYTHFSFFPVWNAHSLAHPTAHSEPCTKSNCVSKICYYTILGELSFPMTRILPPPLPHDRYSCLDYIFLSQQDLPCLTKAKIEPMYLSDHHPIALPLSFSKQAHIT